MSFIGLLGVGLLANGAVAFAAWRLGSVSVSGAVVGAALASVIFSTGGPLFWFVLVGFFLSSTALSRLGKEQKAPLEALHEKGGRRDAFQVVANGGVAMAMAVACRLTGDACWAFGFAAAFAASNADTWAGEVGVLSRKDPVSVLTFRRVQRGISGGISLLGTAASVGGALFIAVLFRLVSGAGASDFPGFWASTAAITACGVAGCFVDSILGATAQAQYMGGAGPVLTEKRSSGGAPNKLVHGLSFVTNDVVNLASTAIAAAAGVMLHRLLA